MNRFMIQKIQRYIKSYANVILYIIVIVYLNYQIKFICSQERERKRINKAGGLVTFNGVWRVAGILATSRALGDYPLKDKKLVIADPDILTFDLKDHNPMFIVLASDGLWDTFSNEEAVAFIKERINEPHFGAKSITLQSFYR